MCGSSSSTSLHFTVGLSADALFAIYCSISRLAKRPINLRRGVVLLVSNLLVVISQSSQTCIYCSHVRGITSIKKKKKKNVEEMDVIEVAGALAKI